MPPNLLPFGMAQENTRKFPVLCTPITLPNENKTGGYPHGIAVGIKE